MGGDFNYAEAFKSLALSARARVSRRAAEAGEGTRIPDDDCGGGGSMPEPGV